MECREVEWQPAAVDRRCLPGAKGEGWYNDVATTAAVGRREPPPLTHNNNCAFLRMLREKERSDRSVDDH